MGWDPLTVAWRQLLCGRHLSCPFRWQVAWMLGGPLHTLHAAYALRTRCFMTLLQTKLAKKAKQNRPIPPWIRFRTNNKIRCAALSGQCAAACQADCCLEA